MNVRITEEGDIAGLLTLYSELHPSDEMMSLADATSSMRRLADISGSCIYIGECEGALVTTCTLVVIPNLTRSGRPYALIENVVTGLLHRNNGYGSLVIKKALERAWGKKCYKVMLLTGSRNPATIRFYEELGFQQSKTGFQIRRS